MNNIPLGEKEQVRFYWEPGRQPEKFEDLADAYAVVETPEADSGIIVYAKYNGEWEANPWGLRPLIKHLLDGQEAEANPKLSPAMKCRLVFSDWRKLGDARSIYSTELGCELSKGDLHNGTTFEAVVQFADPAIEEEIRAAFARHRAYPEFWFLPGRNDAED